MPATTPDPTPKHFAIFLRRAARDAGYDVDQPRSGAVKRLAADSGTPQSVISRSLAGDSLPDIRRFQPLADTLGIPATDLLIAAGYITRPADGAAETHARPHNDSVPSPHTPEDAAIALDIHPDDRTLFVELVRRFTRGGTSA